MKWSDLAKRTRERLGLSRKEFAIFLGVKVNTIETWECRGKPPTPVYQDLIVRLYKHADEIKRELDNDKAKYIPSKPQCKRGDNNFWQTVLKGAVGIGAIILLLGLLTSNDSTPGDKKNGKV